MKKNENHFMSTLIEDIPQNVFAFMSENDNRIILDSKEIEMYNQTIAQKSGMIYSLACVQVKKEEIEHYMNRYSIPKRIKDEIKGLTSEEIEEIESNQNREAITDCEAVKAIVIQRSNLRSFPTSICMPYNENSDFDYFQETELHVNTPILILHESKDKDWYFIKSPIYVGWLKKENIAYACEDDWKFFVSSKDFAICTETLLEIDGILIDMSVKLPYQKITEETVQLVLPSRGPNGLIQKSQVIVPRDKFHIGYLPYTKKNLLLQAFKYKGMSYSWGGKDTGIDCSSYIANLFRTFGFIFPRNASEQNHSVGDIISLQNKTIAEKKQILELYSFGLLFQPGHVMLYLGIKDKKPYIIHASGTKGKVVLTNLNAPNIYISQIDKFITIP